MRVGEEIKFVINTDAASFTRWLESYTATLLLSTFPTQKGYLSVQRARVTSGSLYVPSRVDIEAIYVLPPEQGDTSVAYPIGSVISFRLLELVPRKRIQVITKCSQRAVMDYFKGMLAEIGECWPEAERLLRMLEKAAGRGGGRPPLDHDELIYRLAKAQEGEEIKRKDPEMTWKEIAKAIGWRYGWEAPGIKRLEDARRRLTRLEDDDPDGLLQEVDQSRKTTKR